MSYTLFFFRKLLNVVTKSPSHNSNFSSRNLNRTGIIIGLSPSTNEIFACRFLRPIYSAGKVPLSPPRMHSFKSAIFYRQLDVRPPEFFPPYSGSFYYYGEQIAFGNDYIIRAYPGCCTRRAPCLFSTKNRTQKQK